MEVSIKRSEYRLKFKMSVTMGVWSEGDLRDWNAVRAWAKYLLL